jgi:hypothetical protein
MVVGGPSSSTPCSRAGICRARVLYTSAAPQFHARSVRVGTMGRMHPAGAFGQRPTAWAPVAAAVLRCLWPLVGRLGLRPERLPVLSLSETESHKGSASSANKISLGKYENSVCHVASTVAVKIDYR